MHGLIAGVVAGALALAAGCAHRAAGAPGPAAHAPSDAMPTLRLSPAALPGGLALTQRLTFTRDGRDETVDALVEADATQVRVALHAHGQAALRLAWDGTTLDESRADGLPPALRGERVLSDLQLVFWPREAIAAALPPGWRVDDAAGVRTLSAGGDAVARVAWSAASVAVLENLRDGYRLRIESRPVTP